MSILFLLHQILFLEPLPPSNASRPPTSLPGALNAKMPNTSTAYTRAATILKVFRPTIPRNLLHRLRRHLPRPTFLLLHWAYIITTCMVSSIIFWNLSTPHGYVSYVDSLFLIVAAMTQAGLNTLNLSSLNTFQQCIIFVHIILGNPIFVSAFVVHVRKHAFHTRFRKVAEDKQSKRKTSPSTGMQPVTWQSSFAANSESAMHPRQTLHCASSTFPLLRTERWLTILRQFTQLSSSN